MDVSEIGLEALAGEVPQRDERFLVPTSVFEQVALHLGIPAAVAVFVAEASEDLGGGMPLLGRSVLVVDQDLVDDRLDRPQERSEPIPGRSDGVRLGMLEDIPDGVARMVEVASDLADGLAIAPALRMAP